MGETGVGAAIGAPTAGAAVAGADPSVFAGVVAGVMAGVITGVTVIPVVVVPSGPGMAADGVAKVGWLVDSVTVGWAVVGAGCGSNMFSAMARIKYTTNTETVPTVSASPVRPPNAVSVPPPPPKALASPPP